MAPSAWLSTLPKFLGLHSLHATGLDAYLIIALRSTRLLSAGIPSLTLALFFSSISVPAPKIGLFMTLTLLGDVVLSLLLTLVADSLGRRKILLAGSAMMVCSGAIFALSENFWVLLGAAVVGIISVTGAECGPFRAVEESVLSDLTDQHTRSDVLVWYITFTTLAGAVGTEIAGRVVSWVEKSGGDEKKAYHVLFWGYALFGIIGMILAAGLSKKCEIQEPKNQYKVLETEEDEVLLEAISPRDYDEELQQVQQNRYEQQPLRQPDDKNRSTFSQISSSTRSIMYKLWILLAIDSLADGMIPYSLMNYYVDLKFHLPKTTLGDITSASMFLCAVSAIFAGPLSKCIGLINTMVFTHLPSSLASALIPLPNSVGWTIGLLLFRAALNSMDQAPRTAFIAAVVKPEERTAVMGVTIMLRTLAMAAGPTATGILAGNDRFWIAFLVAGVCRVGYDLGLWMLFIGTRLHQHEEEGVDKSKGEREGSQEMLSDWESEEESGKGILEDVGKRV
ncbi:MFS general substrate transporter [Delitschia confertaspora ATCC 74209]|uniref:MFS general substrate transporter n=1 Tax=Delitschia confertaspora ATCC 74209 TaxID=1513339 RepID=A0A9P4MVE8_9PLEO|nr:MFS general substrate transporter [Delitschia confertaspora ATCC 74209]